MKIFKVEFIVLYMQMKGEEAYVCSASLCGEAYFVFNPIIDFSTLLKRLADRRVSLYDLAFFSFERAKELKAELLDFTGENEVRRSAGLARKIR